MAKDAAAKPVKAYRIAGEVHEAVAAYAKARGTSAGVVVEQACREFLKLAEGGVPDLPVVDSPAAREMRAVAAGPSQRQAAKAASSVFADANGSRQQQLNAAMLRARGKR